MYDKNTVQSPGIFFFLMKNWNTERFLKSFLPLCFVGSVNITFFLCACKCFDVSLNSISKNIPARLFWSVIFVNRYINIFFLYFSDYINYASLSLQKFLFVTFSPHYFFNSFCLPLCMILKNSASAFLCWCFKFSQICAILCKTEMQLKAQAVSG